MSSEKTTNATKECEHLKVRCCHVILTGQFNYTTEVNTCTKHTVENLTVIKSIFVAFKFYV